MAATATPLRGPAFHASLRGKENLFSSILRATQALGATNRVNIYSAIASTNSETRPSNTEVSEATRVLVKRGHLKIKATPVPGQARPSFVYSITPAGVSYLDYKFNAGPKPMNRLQLAQKQKQAQAAEKKAAAAAVLGVDKVESA